MTCSSPSSQMPHQGRPYRTSRPCPLIQNNLSLVRNFYLASSSDRWNKRLAGLDPSHFESLQFLYPNLRDSCRDSLGLKALESAPRLTSVNLVLSKIFTFLGDNSPTYRSYYASLTRSTKPPFTDLETNYLHEAATLNYLSKLIITTNFAG